MSCQSGFTYPRETNEFVAVVVVIDEVQRVTGVEFSITRDGSRPTVWVPQVTHNGEIGLRLTGLAPGRWRVFARAGDGGFQPVVDCGLLYIE